MSTDIITCPCCRRSVFAEDGVIKPHSDPDGDRLCPGSNRVMEHLQPKPDVVVKDVKP